MATYEYNDRIKFILPESFIFKRENMNGEEIVKIFAGEHINEHGDTWYDFHCSISDIVYESDSAEDVSSEKMSKDLLKKINLNKESKYANIMTVADDPRIIFAGDTVPSGISSGLNQVITLTTIETSELSGICIASTIEFDSSSSYKAKKICNNLFEIFQSIRIDCNKIPLDTISPDIIQKVCRCDALNSNIEVEEIKKLHDELRKALLGVIKNSGYSYPEIDHASQIRGFFTKDPDLGVLYEICDYVCKNANSDYDGNWSSSELFTALKKQIGDKEKADQYYYYPDFGGLSPVLALLPFLAAYSHIDSLSITFTHDKWEARGDYSASKRAGIKLSNGIFVIDNFSRNHYFDDKDDNEDLSRYDKWMLQYGDYITFNPRINFHGKLFVFSGISDHANEKNHPIVQSVMEMGGQYRSKVSRLTDYLVVDPSNAGYSKTEAAVELRKKGVDIAIVLLSDLKRALE